MNPIDKQAKEALDKQTNQQTHGLTEEVWNGLEKELFHEEPVHTKEVKNTKKRVIPIVLTAAATLAIVFSLTPDTGGAFMKGIKYLFAPEKEILQSIEGQNEKTDVHLNEGKNSDYVIYLDETRYKMIHGEDSDMITTIEPLPEKYPEVTMEIKQIADEKPEDVVRKIEAELKQEFPALRAIETVTKPVEGFWLHGTAGNDATSKVVTAYIISNDKEGSFIIIENYFLEAAEGHGARFHHMLESFDIVE
ncbi:hypothetical protein [Sporosarcina sp. NPDC096371]|uniref:hypothetical protein n=1 Tax=Sporosarcina sp. NPDC096371 TaxID=3364530 RepID=UPI003812D909